MFRPGKGAARRFAPLLAAILGSGCAFSDVPVAGKACDAQGRCAEGYTCVAGVCRSGASGSGSGSASGSSGSGSGGSSGGAACSDGAKDGDETDLDCGGSCPGCAVGLGCGAPADCQSGACVEAVCRTHAYYVSESAGNDANSGADPAHPWKTLGFVATYPLVPGDAVLFARGDRWNDTLAIGRSGRRGLPLLFTDYLPPGVDAGAAKPAVVGPAGRSALSLGAVSYVQVRDLVLNNLDGRGGGAPLIELAGSPDGGSHDLRFESIDGAFAIQALHAGDRVDALTIEASNLFHFGASGGISGNGNGWSIGETTVSDVDGPCLLHTGGLALSGDVFRACELGSASRSAAVFVALNAGSGGLELADSEITGDPQRCLAIWGGPVSAVGNRIHDCGADATAWTDAFGAHGDFTFRRNQLWAFGSGVSAHDVSGVVDIANNALLAGRADGGPSDFAIAVDDGDRAYLTNNAISGAMDFALRVAAIPDGGSLGYYEERSNLFHDPVRGAPQFLWLGRAMGLGFYSLASGWGSFDGGSTALDPGWVSASPQSPDFHLTSASSAALDQGYASSPVAPLYPACDGGVDSYCGSAPDIGALEYGQ